MTGAICRYDDCDCPTKGGAYGLCRKHHQRMWRHGCPEVCLREWRYFSDDETAGLAELIKAKPDYGRARDP